MIYKGWGSEVAVDLALPIFGASCASLWLLAANVADFSVLKARTIGTPGRTASHATVKLPAGK